MGIVAKRSVIEEVVVMQSAENVCLIWYRLTVDYREDGKALSTKKAFAAAAWVRREEEWPAASCQESRIEE